MCFMLCHRLPRPPAIDPSTAKPSVAPNEKATASSGSSQANIPLPKHIMYHLCRRVKKARVMGGPSRRLPSDTTTVAYHQVDEVGLLRSLSTTFATCVFFSPVFCLLLSTLIPSLNLY